MNVNNGRKKSPLRNSDKNYKNNNKLSKKENISYLINENIGNIFNSINIFYLSLYEIILSFFMFFYYILNTIRLIIMYYLHILFNNN
jgi:hypothetical protein